MQEKTFEDEMSSSTRQLNQCEWVKEEFKAASFGDRRLLLRFLVVAEHLARHPEAPINQASEIWSKTKAAYRFFDNEKVTDEFILQPHINKTIERIKQHCGTALVIQDTTFLNYNHMRASSDLGPIGELKSSHMGLIMHTSLCTTAEGLPLGIMDQHIWARDPKEHGKSEFRKKRPIEDKESFKWIRALRKYHSCIPKHLQVVSVCDSEGDIYDLLSEATKLQAKMLVRAKYNRHTIEGENLFDLLAQQPVTFTDVVSLPASADRPQRDANVSIRFMNTALVCPDTTPIRDKLRTVPVWAIFVCEESPPHDQEPLSWFLLTNVRTKTIAQIKERINWYKRRWQIEIFHRILKSGCHVEFTRLEKNSRRFPFITLNAIIAWKLLLITHYNRILPDAPATSLLSQSECNVLYAITHNCKVEKKTFNSKKAIRWLAQLGGFLARKCDGTPGPTHVWRGWQRLQDFTQMYILTTNST